MVRARKAKDRDLGKVGIHILNPTKFQLERAKEDAYIKGFKTVWVHRKKLKKVI
jgi:hypothetical protein